MNHKLLLGCALAALFGFVLIVAVVLLGGAWYLHSHPASPPPAATAPAASSGANVGRTVEPGGYAFARRNEIYIVPAAGAAEVRLGSGLMPALSPDGRKIAYCRVVATDEGDGGVAPSAFALLDLATGRERELTPTEGTISPPAWSPDSRRIALIAITDGNGRVLVCEAEGGTPFEAYANREAGGIVFNPSWSTDGSLIYFHDMTRLIRIAPAGKSFGEEPLTAFTATETAITSADRFIQSPTNPEIWAFTQNMPGSALFEKTLSGEPITSLFLYDQRTKRARRLTNDQLLAFSPAWSRDGRAIFFCGYPDAAAGELLPFRIYRINADGSGLKELTRGEDPSPR